METTQPKLMFSEFVRDWQLKQLGDIGDVKMCRRIFNEETTSFGEIPFYKIGSFGKEADAFITKELYDNYRNKFSFPNKGDILISAAGTIGRTVVYNGDDAYYQDSNIVWIENNNTTTSNEFLFYIYQIVNFNTEGGTIQRLYNSILKSTKFYNPSLPEQTKIANFLSAVDEKINLLKEKKSLLQEYKKGIMQKIFNQEIRFKDDNGNDFVDWEEKKLSDFMTERNIKSPKSKIYPLMSFVANKGVTAKGARYDREFLVNDEVNKKYKQTEFGDFIYSSNNLETGSIGLNNYGSASISPVYSIFKINEICDYIFINNYLTRLEFISKMIEFRQGVVYGQWRIHETKFLQIKEKLPTLVEQKKIANFLSSIDKKIELVNTQIQDTQEYKKGLLQQMFV